MLCAPTATYAMIWSIIACCCTPLLLGHSCSQIPRGLNPLYPNVCQYGELFFHCYHSVSGGDCFVGLGTPFLGKSCSGGVWRSKLVVLTTSSLEQLHCRALPVVGV